MGGKPSPRCEIDGTRAGERMGEISAAALRRMIRFNCVGRYSGSQ